MGKEINDRPYILQVSLEMASVPNSDAETVQASGHDRFYYESQRKLAKRGGLGDVVTSLAISLHSLGANVGVALPNWSLLFDKELSERVERASAELERAGIHHWDNHLFLVNDPVFERATNIEDIYGKDKSLQSLVFQRKVLSKIQQTNPALIQTHDWSTGLIPPLVNNETRTLNSVHNTNSFYSSLQELQQA